MMNITFEIEREITKRLKIIIATILCTNTSSKYYYSIYILKPLRLLITS